MDASLITTFLITSGQGSIITIFFIPKLKVHLVFSLISHPIRHDHFNSKSLSGLGFKTCIGGGLYYLTERKLSNSQWLSLNEFLNSEHLVLLKSC